MASGEIRQHVALRVQVENVKQNMSNDQAQGRIEKHSSGVIWLLSVMAVAFDPFFFYIPVVKNASTCLGVDNNLRIVIVVLRSLVDVLHTILWWHYSWPLAKSRYEGRESQKHLLVARTVAILAILPLPQVVILAVSWQLLAVDLLKFIVLIQFFIRLYQIIPAYKDATRSSYMLLTYSWFAALFNLIMYTIASNVLGAFWYLRAVERNMDCWKGACYKNQTLCVDSSLYCDQTSRFNGFLHKHCSILQSSSTKSFDYGIYDEAFQTIIIKTDIHFLDKFWQCFWWDLRNMSSLGQNLKTGTNTWDTFFAVVIATCGLVLFAFFIGNMQTYLQTKTPAKLEKMKLRRTHLEEWNPIRVHMLPENLKQEITMCEDPRWQEITEVNLESVLHNIPTELSKKVKSRLCKSMFEKVPGISHLNERRVWEKLCDHAKPVVYPERSYILRMGDPITEIILVLHGDSFSYTEHGKNEGGLQPHRPSSSYIERDKNEVDLQPHQPCVSCIKHDKNEDDLHLHQISEDNYLFFGLELIQHWLPSQKAIGLPIAPRTIKALTKVEAFVISAIDLRSVLGNF